MDMSSRAASRLSRRCAIDPTGRRLRARQFEDGQEVCFISPT
jgi:hypothetical protein